MKWILKDYKDKYSEIDYIIKSPSPTSKFKDDYAIYYDHVKHRHSVVNVIDDQIEGKMRKNLDNTLDLRNEFDKKVI